MKPKSFAGLLGAAPSIALATIGIATAHYGKAYAAIEAHSMLYGAMGFFCYANAASWVLMRFKVHALTASMALLPVWLGVSFGLLWLVGR